MKANKVALGLTLSICSLACTSEKGASVPPAPEPTIITSSVSAYRVVRQGTRPVFERGALRIFVNPGAMDLDMGLPGIALGDAKGPRYGLLGGYFAPRIIAPDTSKNYRVVAETAKSGLRIQFFDGETPVIDAHFGAQGSRPQVNLHGNALLTMPADRVKILGETGGAPAFARGLAAGDAPQSDLRHADRVQVSSEKHGAFIVRSDCANFRIIQPVLRGSTSVFVMQLGASTPPTDHLYAPPLPENPPPLKNCAGTVSSTLSVP